MIRSIGSTSSAETFIHIDLRIDDFQFVIYFWYFIILISNTL